MSKSRVGSGSGSVLGLLACLLCNIAAAQCRAPAIPETALRYDENAVTSIEDIKGPLKLTSLSVFAIIVPATSADQWSVAITNNASNSVRVLSPAEFKHIIDQDKFPVIKMMVSDRLAAAHKKALYFGALNGGDASIFLSNNAARQPNTTAVRISVIADDNDRPAYSRGREIQLTEADQEKAPVPISYGDTIVLTLPGSAFEEWDDVDEKSGLRLTRMRSGDAGHVVFRFAVTGGGASPLVVRQKSPAGTAYRFEFRSVPSISC